MRKKVAAQPTLPEALSRLPKEELVACLASLAATSDEVRAQVEAVLAGADPARATALVRTRLAAVRRSTKHHWGFKGAAEFTRSLDDTLDLVERSVLPAEPAAALDLLAAFIETDAVVFERADDSYGHLGDVYRRACALFGVAARRVPSARVVELLDRLWADDGYGARGTLIRQTSAVLEATARTALIERFRQQMHAAEQPVANPGSVGLMEIADAIGDPELYEEACLFGPRAGHPVFGLHTAQRYLRAGRAAEALARLPARAEDCGGYAHEWTTTRLDVLRALGRTAELQAGLWQQFVAAPCKEALEGWLATAPESERAGMVARAREEAWRERHDPAQQARFFLDLGDADEAARGVVMHAARFDGANYYQLAPLAEGLAATHPLAATVLYRALVEGNLRPALSKYYGHGVRYLRALEKLAPRITAWAPLVPHPEYIADLRAAHARKISFWSRVDGPDGRA